MPKLALRLNGVVALAACMLSAFAHAEVLELEGTVKAVDASACTITIERKTPKGAKTLELEVNKKAGDLAGLKIGDAITLSYDPDLEIVTRLPGKASGPKDATFAVRRVELAVDDLGKVEVCVDTRREAKDPEKPEAGKVIKVSRVPNAQVTRSTNGVCHVVYDFSRVNDFSELKVEQKEQAKIDAQNERLLLTPIFKPDLPKPMQVHATTRFPRSFKLPLRIRLDLDAFNSGVLRIPINIGSGTLLMDLHGTDSPYKAAIGAISIGVRPDNKNWNDWIKPQVFEQNVSLDTDFRRAFQAPFSDVMKGGVSSVEINAIGSPIGIHRIELIGQIVPMLGVQFGSPDGKAVVRAVFEGGAAKAGVRPGDVVTGFNDKPVTGWKDVTARTTELNVGDTATLSLDRDGEKVQLSVVLD